MRRVVVAIDQRCPSPPPRAYPACLLRSHAPLSLERKGQGGRLSRTSSFLRRQESRGAGQGVIAPFVWTKGARTE